MKIITSIFGFLLIIPFFICLLIATPFDYIKYKKSRYYKDTKDKYVWLCGSSTWIKLYNLIKKENLPINFYRQSDAFTGYGYFVYNDTLILYETDPCFDEEQNVWTVEVEDEYVDIKNEVEDEIKECNELLKSDVCKRAVVLIDSDVLREHPDNVYDNFVFLPIEDDDILAALKTLL